MVAFSVHFKQDGVPMQMTLDVVELVTSHSGLNLAKTFAELVTDLEINAKVVSID